MCQFISFGDELEFVSILGHDAREGLALELAAPQVQHDPGEVLEVGRVERLALHAHHALRKARHAAPWSKEMATEAQPEANRRTLFNKTIRFRNVSELVGQILASFI